MNTEMMARASEGLTQGFTAIASSITDGIASIAPIALGVMGTILVWRIGSRFFKSVAK